MRTDAAACTPFLQELVRPKPNEEHSTLFDVTFTGCIDSDAAAGENEGGSMQEAAARSSDIQARYARLLAGLALPLPQKGKEEPEL